MNNHFNWMYNNIRINPIDFNGSTWFLANEICAILEYRNPWDAIAKHVKPIDKNTLAIREGTPGNPNMTIISENGVYDLVFASHMPTAEAFKDYIKTIITSIRQIGYYAEPEVMQQLDANPESVRDLNERVREIIKNTKPQMYHQIDKTRFPYNSYEEMCDYRTENQQYVDLGLAVINSPYNVTLNQLSKILQNAAYQNNNSNVAYGPNELTAIMRRDGYILKSNNNSNVPSQWAVRNYLMEIRYEPVTGVLMTMVTPQGINYFLHKYIYCVDISV